MKAVRVEILRFTDTAQPGWVECRLDDAAGQQWLFQLKVPYVSEAELWTDSPYPQPGTIACEVLETRKRLDGKEIVLIDTERPWDCESTTGQTRFEVFAESVVELR